ncbi:MAG: hypothetical protein U0K83_01210 [Bacteroidales bacterium]|nr:hypothetical protein [Bacteroidales bacterium]
MNLLIIFIILNVVNVIIQTVKSIATVKCGKVAAAVINAIAYGLYTVVTVYMMCELSLGLKALIVGLANLVGVYVVKLIEEKSRKDKLWKVEATVMGTSAYFDLKNRGISCNYFPTSKDMEYIINCYCPTQKESEIVKEILKKYKAKYFVSESKTL